MKLCISNIAWGQANDEQMYKVCSEMGYDGIEIAPTRIFPENPYEHIEDASRWARNIAERYGMKVYSCQSIWYGRNENIFESEKDRECLLEYSKKMFSFAEAVGADNIVFGCPKNRNGYEKNSEFNGRIAVEFFGKIAESASEHGITISVEANPAIYGTDFLNTTEESLKFVNRMEVDSIKLNFDTGALFYNQERLEVINGYENKIGHVHISEPQLVKIAVRKEHQEIYNILKRYNYGKAVSIEMKKQNRLEDIYEVMRYIRDIFADNN